ncbi:MAG: nitroreductase family protein [Chitinophagales bacterium]
MPSINPNTADTFDQIVKDRRSLRVYEENAPFDGDAVRRSLERAVLAPNSSNLQLWEFYRIKSPEKKKEAARLCLNQSAARTAQELIAVVVRPDLWKPRSQTVFETIKPSFSKPLSPKDKRAENYYTRLIPIIYSYEPTGIWNLIRGGIAFFQGLRKPFPRLVTSPESRIVVHKSASLAAQTFMLSMKAEGYDTCPMEGFDQVRMRKFLKLPRRAEISMMISVGVGKYPEGVYGPRFRLPNEEVIFEL